MRRLLSAAAVYLASSGHLAADDPKFAAVRAPAPTMHTTQTWSGIYVGVHAGYSGTQSNLSYDSALLRSLYNIDLGSKGDLRGAHFGFNHHIGGNFYISGELSASFLEVDGRTADILAGPDLSISSKFTRMRTAGLRGGYAFGNLMPYITAGYAGALASNRSDALMSKTAESLQGSYLGLGLEYKILANLSLKIDYARLRFATEQYHVTADNARAKPILDTAKIGVNYFFRTSSVPAGPPN